MNKSIIPVFFIVLIILIAGCEGVDTPTGQVIKEPVKETETKTAPPEQIQEPKEEKPSCSDECSTNSCDGFSYVSCLSGKDGCKYTYNKGLVKGKCGVECVQDSDCESNQNCESYKCKTEEKQEDLTEETRAEETETPSILESLKEVQEKLEDYQKTNSKIDQCAKLCAGEDYDIPYIKDTFWSTCYQLYYYAGEEALDEMIADCK